MALQITLPTDFGRDETMYVRLNNVEASNHGIEARALFRGFVSKAAYRAGSAFLWERTIEFKPDVSKPLWEQAYDALKGHDPVLDLSDEIGQLDAEQQRVDESEASLKQQIADTEEEKGQLGASYKEADAEGKARIDKHVATLDARLAEMKVEVETLPRRRAELADMEAKLQPRVDLAEKVRDGIAGATDA